MVKKDKQESVVELNLGKSIITTYMKTGEGMKEQDIIIRIPEQGLTEPDCDSDYFSFKESKADKGRLNPIKSGQAYATVNFFLPDEEDSRFEGGIQRMVVMPWIPEIGKSGEWVVLRRYEWEDDFPHKDERWEGPFALNKYCMKNKWPFIFHLKDACYTFNQPDNKCFNF